MSDPLTRLMEAVCAYLLCLRTSALPGSTEQEDQLWVEMARARNAALDVRDKENAA